jgi:hypothetical protein
MRYLNIYLNSAICPQCGERVPVFSSFGGYIFVKHSILAEEEVSSIASIEKFKLCEPEDGVERRYMSDELVDFIISTLENNNPFIADVQYD